MVARHFAVPRTSRYWPHKAATTQSSAPVPPLPLDVVASSLRFLTALPCHVRVEEDTKSSCLQPHSPGSRFQSSSAPCSGLNTGFEPPRRSLRRPPPAGSAWCARRKAFGKTLECARGSYSTDSLVKEVWLDSLQ
jgi:hypothetical protein